MSAEIFANSDDIIQATSVLRGVFGLKDFRGEQAAILARVLKGASSLVLMPTGGGKSLCYQIPARVHSERYRKQGGPRPPLVVVVSPLIALMKDQVDRLCKIGLRAGSVHSQLTADERAQVYRDLSQGSLELIYVTPERFRKEEFWNAIQQLEVKLLAVDEAHCVSEWGHDFRPDFTRIRDARERLQNPPVLALTATATLEVQQDIVKELGLTPSELKVFSDGVKRPELSLSVEIVHGLDDKIRHLVLLRSVRPGPCIVYFSLISTLKKAAYELQRLGTSCITYHGQLPRDLRRQAQERFISGEHELILATPAFGLGIDKSDVRCVVHFEVPGGLEDYFQEVGRAGRDGAQAWGLLLYDPDDVSIQEDFVKWGHPEPDFIMAVYRLLERTFAAGGEKEIMRLGLDGLRAQMLFYHRRDFRLETALNLLERYEFIEGDLSTLEIRPIKVPEGSLVDPERAEKRLKNSRLQLLKLVQYVQTKTCRARQIYEYFGSGGEECGICDNCKPRPYLG